MDDLFGKDDSTNEDSDAAIDMDSSYENQAQREPKDSGDNGMDIDVMEQVVKHESESLSSCQSISDAECPILAESDDRLDIVKHEIEINGSRGGVAEHSQDNNAFANDLTMAHPDTPSCRINIVKREIEIDNAKADNDGGGGGGGSGEHCEDNALGNDLTMARPTAFCRIKERRESHEKSKREIEEEEREKMQVLVSNFTEDQLDRYEMYRRAAFPKAAIKRIMQTITGCSVSQNVVIAMSGIAKVFIGELVEESLDVMEANEETGPLQPKHLREAVRRLRLEGQIPNGRAHKAFFRL